MWWVTNQVLVWLGFHGVVVCWAVFGWFGSLGCDVVGDSVVVVGGCGSGGVAVEWLVVCCEMGVWLWVWLFMGVLWLWVWVFGLGYVGVLWL